MDVDKEIKRETNIEKACHNSNLQQQVYYTRKDVEFGEKNILKEIYQKKKKK